MLQRIHDTVGTWVAVLVLGLITAGFVFWRADYGGVGRASYAAKVNGENVSVDEFDRELQARQNQFQQQYRTELTEDMRKELRRSVIERMVNDTVLKQRVAEQHYRVSDATRCFRTASFTMRSITLRRSSLRISSVSSVRYCCWN